MEPNSVDACALICVRRCCAASSGRSFGASAFASPLRSPISICVGMSSAILAQRQNGSSFGKKRSHSSASFGKSGKLCRCQCSIALWYCFGSVRTSSFTRLAYRLCPRMVIPFAAANERVPRGPLLSSRTDRPCLVDSSGVHNALYQGEDSLDLGPLPPTDPEVERAKKESPQANYRQRRSATGCERTAPDEADRNDDREHHDRVPRREDVPSFDIDCRRAARFTDVAQEKRLKAIS